MTDSDRISGSEAAALYTRILAERRAKNMNPLEGILTSAQRQSLIAIMENANKMRHPHATSIAHALGLHLNVPPDPIVPHDRDDLADGP